MPLYATKITVPANTSENSPVSKEIAVEGDVITYISILIPPGHFGLTGIRLLYGIKQIAPYNDGEWLSGDGETISYNEFLIMPEKEYNITIEAYNTDEVYDHTFYVRIVTNYLDNMITVKAFKELMDWIKAFVQAFGVSESYVKKRRKTRRR